MASINCVVTRAKVRSAIALLGGVCVLFQAHPTWSAATDPVALSPHRAVYDFKLGRAGSGGITDMTGRMVYELTGSACDGFTQTMRFVTRATSRDGNTAVNDMRSTSFEDAAAKSLKFSVSQYKDDKLAEATAGEADRGNDEIKVELKKPAAKTLKFGPGALFPVQHSIALIEAARQDQSVFQSDLYDGSDKGEKVYATTAVIGRMKPAGQNKTLPRVENAEPLETQRSWPVSMSYFDKAASQSTDAVPTYELAFLFFENGVVRQLTLDYGDFALKGDLQKIEFLVAAKCEKK